MRRKEDFFVDGGGGYGSRDLFVWVIVRHLLEPKATIMDDASVDVFAGTGAISEGQSSEETGRIQVDIRRKRSLDRECLDKFVEFIRAVWKLSTDASGEIPDSADLESTFFVTL